MLAGQLDDGAGGLQPLQLVKSLRRFEKTA